MLFILCISTPKLVFSLMKVLLDRNFKLIQYIITTLVILLNTIGHFCLWRNYITLCHFKYNWSLLFIAKLYYITYFLFFHWLFLYIFVRTIVIYTFEIFYLDIIWAAFLEASGLVVQRSVLRRRKKIWIQYAFKHQAYTFATEVAVFVRCFLPWRAEMFTALRPRSFDVEPQ